MRWMLLVLAITTPVMADEFPAPVTVPAAASAAAPGDYTITVVSAAASAAAAKPASTATVAPAVSSTAPKPAATDAPSCDDIKIFKDKMHTAVDAALKYPAELKFRPTSGVTFVAYEYQDGHTENVHITQWSGDGRLDRAAVAAVKNADFSSITPGIGHKHIHDVVIIIFDNYKDDGGKNTKDQSPGKQLGQDCR